MHVLNLVFRIKLIFSSINLCTLPNSRTSITQQIFKCSNSINILEINHNRITNSKKKQVIINVDIKSTKTPNKSLINNFVINQKICQKYWQEFLYISSNYPESNAFENIISQNYFIQNLQIEDSKHKKTEEILRYNLLNGKVKVSYPRFLDTQNPFNLSIQYIWRKGINRVLPICSYHSYQNKHQLPFLNQVQNRFLQVLKQQKFPVFIVINGLNQVVINQPEHLINIKQPLSNLLLWSVYRIFMLPKEYSLPLREAYIFINPMDAIEYYIYIKSQYPKSAKQLQLKLFIGNLDEFYKTNRLSLTYTQFRLLPDLKEIGKLVTQYQYKNHVYFDSKQIYGKNYFQGQPIYFIKPVIYKYNDHITGTKKQHYFPNLLDLTQKEYFHVFTTYQDAILAWKKYRRKFVQYSLYQKPLLKVYNMESFLRENENQLVNNQITQPKFRLVPSRETYQYIKKLQKNTRNSFFNTASIKRPSILLVQVWINKILWGMLRWNPPE